MAGHQDISIKKETKIFLIFAEKLKVEAVTLGFSERGLSLISPSDHMIQSPGKMDPWPPCHGRSVTVLKSICQYLII